MHWDVLCSYLTISCPGGLSLYINCLCRSVSDVAFWGINGAPVSVCGCNMLNSVIFHSFKGVKEVKELRRMSCCLKTTPKRLLS